jgi:hypothetical protein
MNEVDALNRALKRSGQTVILRRTNGTTSPTYVDVTLQAVVRGYQPQELVAGISQEDALVIFGPTEITNAGWPGTGTDMVPSENLKDLIIINGVKRKVASANGIFVQNVLVRIEARVLG